MRKLRKYNLNDKIDFGNRYIGHTIKEAYQFVPDFLDYCIKQVPFFYIDIEQFEYLPDPTPMKIMSLTINGKEIWVSNYSLTKNYIKEAKKYLNEGNKIPSEKFRFSDLAKKITFRKNEKFIENEDLRRNIDDNYFHHEITEFDSRYEKYGGYNGFSDDTIDEAFGGDSDATWNID